MPKGTLIAQEEKDTFKIWKQINSYFRKCNPRLLIKATVFSTFKELQGESQLGGGVIPLLNSCEGDYKPKQLTIEQDGQDLRR